MNFIVNNYVPRIEPTYTQETHLVVKPGNVKNKFFRKVVEFILKKLEKHHVIYEEQREVFNRNDVRYEQVAIDLDNIDRCIEETYFKYREQGIDIYYIMLGRDLLEGIDKLGNIVRTEIPKSYNLRLHHKYIGVQFILNPFMDGVVFIPRNILS